VLLTATLGLTSEGVKSGASTLAGGVSALAGMLGVSGDWEE